MLKNIRKRILDSLYKNEVDLNNTKRILKLNDSIENYADKVFIQKEIQNGN